MKRISAAVAVAFAFAAMVSAAPAATAKTRPDTMPPAAPTNLHVVNQAANTVKLAWNAPPNATPGFTYFISGEPCSPQMVGNATSFTLASSNVDPNCGMFPRHEYHIAVKVQDDAGRNSPYSNSVSVTLTG